MACGKFLDLQGLETFYKKLKVYIDSKVNSSTTDVTVTQGEYSNSTDNTYEVGTIKVGDTTTTLYGIDTQGSSSTSVTLKEVRVEEVPE